MWDTELAMDRSLVFLCDCMRKEYKHHDCCRRGKGVVSLQEMIIVKLFFYLNRVSIGKFSSKIHGSTLNFLLCLSNLPLPEVFKLSIVEEMTHLCYNFTKYIKQDIYKTLDNSNEIHVYTHLGDNSMDTYRISKRFGEGNYHSKIRIYNLGLKYKNRSLFKRSVSKHSHIMMTEWIYLKEEVPYISSRNIVPLYKYIQLKQSCFTKNKEL